MENFSFSQLHFAEQNGLDYLSLAAMFIASPWSFEHVNYTLFYVGSPSIQETWMHAGVRTAVLSFSFSLRISTA